MNVNNAREVNYGRLESFCSTARNILSELIGNDPDNAFTAPKNTAELAEHNKQVESIIVSKIRTITKI